MVFNALKRIFKPECRIVSCTECKIYYLQRRRVISGDWEYLTDDAFGFWAMEFNSYSEAREYAKKLHKLRPYKLRLLVVKKCDVWDHV
ncbi:hypothetical protein H1N87_gp44 [Escherichia phage herni]|uniref:Uncharacterized protein n=1 Tax=Escherichia phage herni TaxID=2696404 RepID=A0A6B9X7B8_9CAUD|nr:hypothetical protein H1N87_gp44 [Escherichia phage herni]QHR74777.1 hypothetical protein herni_44 [Escherichia phage herni]